MRNFPRYTYTSTYSCSKTNKTPEILYIKHLQTFGTEACEHFYMVLVVGIKPAFRKAEIQWKKHTWEPTGNVVWDLLDWCWSEIFVLHSAVFPLAPGIQIKNSILISSLRTSTLYFTVMSHSIILKIICQSNLSITHVLNSLIRCKNYPTFILSRPILWTNREIWKQWNCSYHHY